MREGRGETSSVHSPTTSQFEDVCQREVGDVDVVVQVSQGKQTFALAGHGREDVPMFDQHA